MESTSSKLAKIFTIGYAAFEINAFISILKRYNITAVADVRSSPYSKFKPGYNKENLARTLKVSSIQYVFLDESLGARFEDRSVYKNGAVDFELVSKLDSFRQGIDRLIEGAKKYTIALMCAEQDPIKCHRSILVAKNLVDNFNIFHIHDDTYIESHIQLEHRLEKCFGYDQGVLFGDTLQMAYEEQVKKIAYVGAQDGAIDY